MSSAFPNTQNSVAAMIDTMNKLRRMLTTDDGECARPCAIEGDSEDGREETLSWDAVP
jgi:hypothetical protein